MTVKRKIHLDYCLLQNILYDNQHKSIKLKLRPAIVRNNDLIRNTSAPVEELGPYIEMFPSDFKL